jgi:diguanylate cyclase (GGDEF)-like protein
MSGLGWLLGGMVAGAAGALIWNRRAAPGGAEPGVDPALAPDPALRWLARAHQALGVWVTAGAGSEDPPRWQRVVPGERLSPANLEAIESRLGALRSQAASGAERLQAGVLLYASGSGLIVGMLLPVAAGAEPLREAGDDLVVLLDALGRRPLMDRALAEEEGPGESLGSIGLRLAYQLERVLNAEVIVAVDIQGHVRVIGTSSRADRRLLDSFAQPGSPMYQVARGEVASLTSIADPLGGIVHDRRTHFTPAIIYPIRYREEPVGAVAIWTDDNGAPIGPVIAEVQEALRNAGPRIARARRTEELGNAAVTDPLTGLKNRRGLEDAMRRVGTTQGTLIYADFDKFKLLNDQLGHHAGDAALVHFARLVYDLIRGGDTAARIGGEEFAVWLPGASLVYGAKVADRIRIKLGTVPWDWQGRSWPLSASFGVSAMPDTTRSLDNLAAQADAALMEAKRLGRNRVETARPLA